MTLINDILDLSKIEAGKVDVLQEDVQLEEIIAEVSAPISMLAKEKKINYHVERKINSQSVIKTDRGKVVQVLINLLGNAVKYTDEGKVVLSVSSNNNLLNFEVIDTGIGISDEEVEIIFEEFRQSNNSSSRSRGGTGLGLAICQKLAVILEGELNVKSELNKGSTFTFSIPFIPGKESAREKRNISEDALSIFHDEKTSIVLIDFDNEAASIAKNYFPFSDYELTFIHNNSIDLHSIIELKPAVILLNVNLIDNKSWNIITLIKQNLITQNIPLMLLAFNDQKDNAYVINVANYMLKPFSGVELSQSLLSLESSSKRSIQNVVIIDNDLNELEKNTQLLSLKAVNVISVSQADEALKRIEEVKPDAVIMNIAMPGIDGISINHMLKSNPETSYIPVILTLESKLNLKSQELLTGVMKSIAQNSDKKISETFSYVKDWIKGKVDIIYPLSAKENINVKLEITNNNLSEIQSNTNENAELDIMIVDDDPNTLFTLADIVQSYHCNPIVAHSGKECLELLEIKTPDLIFLDIIMPEMDGFKTISRIKDNKKWSDIPVFAVTAKAMKEDNEIILKHGFTDYIPKPVNPAFVQYKIQSLITQLKTT
jgi:CheY-like chemotaxis protein/anti-sigma regulatory factor (Ser/Thr protein kinase)